MALAGCADGPDGSTASEAIAGPVVAAVDSVLLDEAGMYLGNPFSLVPDTLDGTFLVSDFFEDRILRYERDGSLRQTYGQPGPGPGQFGNLGAAFPLNDSVVVGDDGQRKLLNHFSRTDGSYLGSVRYSGRLGMGGYPVVGDSVVVMPVWAVESLTTTALWRVADGKIDYSVPFPDEYLRSVLTPSGYVGQFAAFWSRGTVAAWQDTILLGMGGLNEIYAAGWDGTVTDTLRPPKVRRRGVMANVQEYYDDPDNFRESGSVFSSISSQKGLYRLSGGALAVLHHDLSIEGVQPTGIVTADIWLTVIAADRNVACVDGRVPHFQEMRPVHAIVRDTLYLLDRRLNDSEDGLESWIRMYEIDTAACDWIEML